MSYSVPLKLSTGELAIQRHIPSEPSAPWCIRADLAARRAAGLILIDNAVDGIPWGAGVERKKLVIVGAGGFGREIAPMVLTTQLWQDVGPSAFP